MPTIDTVKQSFALVNNYFRLLFCGQFGGACGRVVDRLWTMPNDQRRYSWIACGQCGQFYLTYSMDITYLYGYLGAMLQASDLTGMVHIVHIVHKCAGFPRPRRVI
jgi:hypothetical protein